MSGIVCWILTKFCHRSIATDTLFIMFDSSTDFVLHFISTIQSYLVCGLFILLRYIHGFRNSMFASVGLQEEFKGC
jgi:hypothetical protein